MLWRKPGPGAGTRRMSPQDPAASYSRKVVPSRPGVTG
jgi:hypothetical protein